MIGRIHHCDYRPLESASLFGEEQQQERPHVGPATVNAQTSVIASQHDDHSTVSFEVEGTAQQARIQLVSNEENLLAREQEASAVQTGENRLNMIYVDILLLLVAMYSGAEMRSRWHHMEDNCVVPIHKWMLVSYHSEFAVRVDIR